MSVFEFVFGLFSLVLALGLTHMLGGAAELVRRPGRVKLSFVHGVWWIAAFASTLGNWASLWSYRDLAVWPAWTVLLQMMFGIVNYMLCYLVTPPVPDEGAVDLADFHKRDGRGYIAAFAVLGVMATLYNVAFGLSGLYDQWVRDTIISAPFTVGAILCLLIRATWFQAAVGFGTAASALLYLVAASSIGTSPT